MNDSRFTFFALATFALTTCAISAGACGGGGTSTSGTSSGAGGVGGTSGMASSSTGARMCVPSGPETCQSPADEDCDGKECGVWARVFGSPGFFGSSDYSAVTASGEVYFSAYVEGSFQFGGMTVTTDVDHKLVIAKLTASGDDVWIHQLPTPGAGGLAPLEVTPGGGVAFAVAFDKALKRASWSS